jgi:hypothetical protein
MSTPRWTLAVLLLGAVGLTVHAAAPPPETLEHLWAELATTDPVKPERVMARLLARPAQTVSFLRKYLRPVTVDGRRVAQWLAELDSDQYEIRERASKALEHLSEAVEPELRRRIERLLKRVRGERLSPSGQRRRAVSAIEVLERIGNAEAQEVLAALARGAPTAALTVDARGALERMVRVNDS